MESEESKLSRFSTLPGFGYVTVIAFPLGSNTVAVAEVIPAVSPFGTPSPGRARKAKPVGKLPGAELAVG